MRLRHDLTGWASTVAKWRISAGRAAPIYPHLARFAFCEFPRTPLFLMRSWQIPSIATFAVRTARTKIRVLSSRERLCRLIHVPPVMHRPPRVAGQFHSGAVVPIMSAERAVRRARAAIADEHRRRNADRVHTAGAWRIEGQLTRAAGSRLPRAYSQPWVAKSLFHMPMTASAAFSKSTCLAGAVSETIPVRV